jgi:hypothetical protein
MSTTVLAKAAVDWPLSVIVSRETSAVMLHANGRRGGDAVAPDRSSEADVTARCTLPDAWTHRETQKWAEHMCSTPP